MCVCVRACMHIGAHVICACVYVCVWGGGGGGLIPMYHEVIVLEGVDCSYLAVNRDH